VRGLEQALEAQVVEPEQADLQKYAQQ
jgi:hypothetical protein